MLLPGAVVPGIVLGGLAGVPGLLCEFDGLGVMLGTVPDPLFKGAQGGRLPGTCAPGVEPGVVDPGVVAPGVVVPGLLAPSGCVVPGVVVPGVDGDEGVVYDGLDGPVCVPGEEFEGLLGLCEAPLPGELESRAMANAATPSAQLKNMLEKTLFLLIRSPFIGC